MRMRKRHGHTLVISKYACAHEQYALPSDLCLAEMLKFPVYGKTHVEDLVSDVCGRKN